MHSDGSLFGLVVQQIGRRVTLDFGFAFAGDGKACLGLSCAAADRYS